MTRLIERRPRPGADAARISAPPPPRSRSPRSPRASRSMRWPERRGAAGAGFGESALGLSHRRQQVRRRLRPCVTACRDENGWGGHGRAETNAQWIRKVTLKDPDGGPTREAPVMCQHCAEPPCVDVCPTGASFKRADGIVLVDKHICIGCRYCMMACPYKARSFVHEPVDDQKPWAPRGRGTVEGCTMCVHRIDEGRPPACAQACASEAGGAMMFGDLNDPSSEISRAVAGARQPANPRRPRARPGRPLPEPLSGVMAKLTFRKLEDHSPLMWGMMAGNLLVLAAGLLSALYMEGRGHAVTGMSNQIVWGMPHVFAVFLIVAASGALNVASISSVFNQLAYKPYARLSGILAIALLAGGLMVLVLDLGRPERVFVAMTHYNFHSIFAWNIYLYSGFVAIVAAYLFTMMDRRVSRQGHYTKIAGALAFVWRLALTTGTGSIFGFLVAREAYDTAILAPLFIAASFLYGLSFTVLILVNMTRETREELMNEEMLGKFRGLLAIFSLSVLYLTATLLLTQLYGAGHRGVVAFLLRDGGVYPLAFWLGQIVIGSVAPLLVLLAMKEGARGRQALTVASFLFLVGGLCQFYVIIIGGQAWPLNIFPGRIVSSSFFDGAIASYTPSAPEALLGLSGVSLAMLITALALRLMPFLPKGAPTKGTAA